MTKVLREGFEVDADRVLPAVRVPGDITVDEAEARIQSNIWEVAPERIAERNAARSKGPETSTVERKRLCDVCDAAARGSTNARASRLNQSNDPFEGRPPAPGIADGGDEYVVVDGDEEEVVARLSEECQRGRHWRARLHLKVSLRSHSLNEMNYRVHVAPFFGDCPLAGVTPPRILEFRAKLQSAGLSARTTNLLLALVRAILRFAVANGHVTASPTDRLGRGKLMLPIEKAKLAPPIEKSGDVGRLLEAIKAARPDRFAFFATLVYTGMRKGEACGLRWADVDLERRIITIRHSYSGPTKSGSHREVPMPAPLVGILRAHRLAEPFQGAIVFPNDAGEMYTKNGKLEDVLRAALARIGLARIRLHDLRHVHAAHFMMAGGNVYDLQKNLGHHSVAFTASVYGHLSADHRVRESDRLAFEVPHPAKVLPFEKASA